MALFTHYSLKLVFALANEWKPLGRFINRVLVSYLVSRVRRRPHPFSTLHDYTSWRSLTEKTWSGRHLPPKKSGKLPKSEDLAKLFVSENGEQEYSDKSTLLFPFFAQYLTDGVIRTVMPNSSANEDNDTRKQNTSNHLVDLCSLYGLNRDQTLALRQRSQDPGQRGRLKSQTINNEEFAPFLFDENGLVKDEFAGLDKVLGIDKVTSERKKTIFAFGGDRANISPMISMLNTLFLREHNRLAGEIERDHPDWDDERIFEVSRNCIIAMFLKIVIEEYLDHISEVNLRLKLDPTIAWKAPWNRPNWITTEFSLFYRWHALIPMNVTWNGEELPVRDTFFNNDLLIQRGLVGAFEDTSDQHATKLRMGNMSPALAEHEKKGIEQGRLCELAPFVDYCDYFAIDPPEQWGDFSENPALAKRLEELYGSPEDVEFYIGAFAAEPTLNSPLSPFMLRLAAVDGFSQALTNPLLSEHVWNERTFSSVGWRTLEQTSNLRDVLTRVANSQPSKFVGMTDPGWEQKAPPSTVLTALKETLGLWQTRSGRFRLAGLGVVTLAEALGLILWLALTQQGSYFLGFVCLFIGEAIEWAALAYMIVNSPLSHPKKTGRVSQGLVTSGITSTSEAFLWLGWFYLIPQFGVVTASVMLLVAMHAKHVTEMKIFTGRGLRRLAFNGRDITASIIEVAGAAIWYVLAVAGYPVLGGLVLLAMLLVEHVLQFKTAGFLKPSR